MYRLDKSRGAVYSLQYHLILVVKYRQKVFLNEGIINFLKDRVVDVSINYEVEILEQECDIDHIHILFRSKPTLDITKYINVLKGSSSKIIRNTYKEFLKDKLWGNAFWSPSYFLATSGNVSIEVLKRYIENQGKDNAKSI